LRLAIDASRTTSARVTGTERYALEMIRALLQLDLPFAVTLFFRDTPPPNLFAGQPELTTRVIPFARAWTHARFAAELMRERFDLVWVPAHTLPFAFSGRAAVTIHDLGYKHFPEAHPPRQRAYLNLTTRYSAGRARVVLADSRATADDLNRFYKTPPDKIRVVYPGVDVPVVGDLERVRAKYNLPERYFLFLGTLQPRKNIARLAQAFRQFKREHPESGMALVLAGAQGWLFDPGWVEGIENVIITGYVEDADKGAIYSGATALVFPSLYEGFGFPVLEAMGCGTPVICSNTSSLPELAGDAALLVSPLEIEMIANAMRRVYEDRALREDMIAKGYQRIQQFTWESAAKSALDALLQGMA